MGKLADNYNFGNLDAIELKDLIVILQQMYRDLARSINQKADVYERTTDGAATDTFLSNGTININSNTNKVEILTNHVNPTTVTWTTIS